MGRRFATPIAREDPGFTPNGMPCNWQPHGECAAWKTMKAKAIRDIEAHRAMFEVRDMAEAITDEQIQSDLETIRQWANSLKTTS